MGEKLDLPARFDQLVKDCEDLNRAIESLERLHCWQPDIKKSIKELNLALNRTEQNMRKTRRQMEGEITVFKGVHHD